MHSRDHSSQAQGPCHGSLGGRGRDLVSPKGAREGASWEPSGLNKRMIGVSGFDSVSACLAFSRGSLLPEAPRADSEANRLSNRGLLQFQAAPHLPGPRALPAGLHPLALPHSCPISARKPPHSFDFGFSSPKPHRALLLLPPPPQSSFFNPLCQEASFLPCSEILFYPCFSSCSFSPFSASSTSPSSRKPSLLNWEGRKNTPESSVIVQHHLAFSARCCKWLGPERQAGGPAHTHCHPVHGFLFGISQALSKVHTEK